MYHSHVFIYRHYVPALCTVLSFVTEMKSVYSAVGTGSLNKAVWGSSLKGYLRTNSDLCHLQHKLSGFYNRDEVFTERYGLGL
jgi:hypothetical protein